MLRATLASATDIQGWSSAERAGDKHLGVVKSDW